MESALKKPMTTEEFFRKITAILEEKGKVPDILDYKLATREPIQIRTHEFNLISKLSYGESEGIYLDLYIEYYTDGTRFMNSLGTFKTLQVNDNAMHTMSGLLADFIIEGYFYIDENIDDFTWEGVDVRPYDESEKTYYFGYTCINIAEALKKKDELLKSYPCVIVRNNRTRSESIFKTEDDEDPDFP